MTVARPSSRTRSSSFLRSVTSGTRSSAARVRTRARRAARAAVACRCGRSHGTPPNCSACVISCSATQRSSWSAGASRPFAACARLGATNSSRAGLLGLEHRELVLAEHAPGEEAGDRAGLDRQHAAGDRPQRPELAAEPLAPWARARVSSDVEVGVDPARRGRPPRRPARAGRRRARCRRRRGARPPRRARRAARTAPGSPAGCRFATPRATVPASFQSITCSRMPGVLAPTARRGPSAHVRRGPPRVRAAITGECGSRSSGAASGSS